MASVNVPSPWLRKRLYETGVAVSIYLLAKGVFTSAEVDLVVTAGGLLAGVARVNVDDI